MAASLAHCPRRLLLAPPGRYELTGWEQRQEARAGEGPLAALETALAWSQAVGLGWAAVSSVDTPLLTPEMWAALWEALCAARQQAPSPISVVGWRDEQGRGQPLLALYRVEGLPRITAALDSGERRLQAAHAGAGALWLQPEALGFSPMRLRDADTPEALQELEAWAAQPPTL